MLRVAIFHDLSPGWLLEWKTQEVERREKVGKRTQLSMEELTNRRKLAQAYSKRDKLKRKKMAGGRSGEVEVFARNIAAF